MKYNLVTIIAVLLICFAQDSICQRSVQFFVKGVYNNFSLGDLKVVQKDLVDELNSLRMPSAIIDGSFSQHYGLQFRLGLPVLSQYFHYMDIGVLFDYSSNTGKVKYISNSSGEFISDQSLSIYCYGAYIEKQFHIFNDFWLVPGISAQIVSANFDFSNQIEITDPNTRINQLNERYEKQYDSFSFGIEPNAEIRYDKYYFSLGINFGYMVEVPFSSFKDNEIEYNLIKKNDEPVNLDMNGLRIGVTAGVSF